MNPTVLSCGSLEEAEEVPPSVEGIELVTFLANKVLSRNREY